MNKELMRAIADQIEAEPERFNMHHWKTDTACGSTYCVAGWALALSNQEELIDAWVKVRDSSMSMSRLIDMNQGIVDAADVLLGIDGEGLYTSGYRNTPMDAATKLRKFADEGRIDLTLWRREDENFFHVVGDLVPRPE